jgi:hypothetical protein
MEVLASQLTKPFLISFLLSQVPVEGEAFEVEASPDFLPDAVKGHSEDGSDHFGLGDGSGFAEGEFPFQLGVSALGDGDRPAEAVDLLDGGKGEAVANLEGTQDIDDLLWGEGHEAILQDRGMDE